MRYIYKILTINEWEKFQTEDIFHGTALDEKDGFIHCSYEDQYLGVKEKFFKDQGPLILLTIDSNVLPAGSLKIEANRPGGAQYPHLYTSLFLSAVSAWQIIE